MEPPTRDRTSGGQGVLSQRNNKEVTYRFTFQRRWWCVILTIVGDWSDHHARLFKACIVRGRRKKKWCALVITSSALALEQGLFKFIWLLEKQVPDPTLYAAADDDGEDMSDHAHVTTNRSLQKKKDEVEDKQMKVFGILIDLIEPGKRAWTLINEVIKTGDPVAVYKVLKERYGSNTVPVFFRIC